MFTFQNLNQSLIGLSKLLLEEGIARETRGFACIEYPRPILICIENPCDRYVTIPSRKWNKILPFAESLWLALGLNDLDALPGTYVKNLYNFSDNGHTWRGGYGTRFRNWAGLCDDYYISDRKEAHVYTNTVAIVDQFKFVIDTLKRDINSRQAGITVHDPARDDFDYPLKLKETKDQPCTRLIHFQMMGGKLDCTVFIRSNDLLWGYSAVNVFNFTLIQEYIANTLGVPVGKYYHFANNLHFYENFKENIQSFAAEDPSQYESIGEFYYQDKIESLEKFDENIDYLYSKERALVRKESFNANFELDMFDDWFKVFYNYWNKEANLRFKNPYLNRLFYGK